MNSFNEQIAKYRAASSRKYHNAVGDEVVANAQALDPNDRTLSVSLNPIVSTLVGRARIFGASLGTDESYNTANNMLVVIDESSHTIVKNSLFGSPFRIKGLIYSASSLAQLAKPFSLIMQSIAGSNYTKVFQPQNYIDPRNFTQTMIKTSAFQNVVNADTRIEIDFVVGASATMILTISDKMDMSQALSNRTPIQSSK